MNRRYPKFEEQKRVFEQRKTGFHRDSVIVGIGKAGPLRGSSLS